MSVSSGVPGMQDQMQLDLPFAASGPNPARKPAPPPSSLTDDDMYGDKLREECGVFGVFGHPDAAALTALGLHALQHRGQEAAGIVAYDGEHFHSERRLGLVGDHFSSASVVGRLKGDMSIGH